LPSSASPFWSRFWIPRSMSPCSICPLRFAGPPLCCSHTCAGEGISGKGQLQIAGCTCAHALADNACVKGHMIVATSAKARATARCSTRGTYILAARRVLDQNEAAPTEPQDVDFPVVLNPLPVARGAMSAVTRVCVHTPLVPCSGGRPGAVGAPNTARKHRRILRVFLSPLICAGEAPPSASPRRPTHRVGVRWTCADTSIP
jgi:hypothetical protein